MKSLVLSEFIHTLGQHWLQHYGERVHKLAINAGFTCPNRDGSKGIGGCTFCNNQSFNPNAKKAPSIAEQIAAGAAVLKKRTGAQKFVAYFQAYTNTYAQVDELDRLYQQALRLPNVIGLSVGTRPDCVPNEVLRLLADYQQQGHEVWLELGLQSAFDCSLKRVNRGHGWQDYADALRRAHAHGLSVCTHLIIGLPGENEQHALISLQRVIELGVEGLKLHPLHVVKATRLANQWRRGEYQPWSRPRYIETVAQMIALTPPEVIYHRLTGTAEEGLLLAPAWCSQKWSVLNGITRLLARRGLYQGSDLGASYGIGLSSR